MTEIRKKFIVVSVPLMGALIWSFVIMIKSFGTYETSRIVLSSVGFLVFFLVALLLLKQWREEEKEDKEI